LNNLIGIGKLSLPLRHFFQKVGNIFGAHQILEGYLQKGTVNYKYVCSFKTM
jgi:hypothetical protein